MYLAHGFDLRQYRGRHVLGLDGQHVAVGGKLQRRVDVVQPRLDQLRERRRAGIGIGIERAHAEPHAPRLHGQHAAELATSQHADGGARQQHHGSWLSASTAAVWRAR